MNRRSVALTLAVALVSACSGDDDSAATATAAETTTVAASTTTTSTTTSTTTAAPPPPGLVDRPCGAIPGRHAGATCHFLDVPERRDVPGSRTIRLWVEVVTPDGTPPDAVPLVWLTGGPGLAASAVLGRTVANIGTRRPLVFVDQRGTGRSEPRLDCHELDQLFVDSTAPWAQRVDTVGATAATCRDRLVAAGVDLAAYNTAEDADDIVDLRRALGYERWLVYGISYGGRLAQQVLRRDDAGVAGVVLDSSTTSEPLGPASLVERADDAIARLAAACAAQPTCAGEIPDLRATFDAAVQRLDTAPYTSHTRNGTTLVVSGQEVISGAFRAQYDRELIKELPGTLAAIAAGDNGVIDALVAQLTQPGDGASGLLTSSLCADDGADLSDADRAVLADPGERGSLLLNWPWPVCDVWGVPPVPGGPLVAPTSDVPVLLFEGGLDPVTPPRFADLITAHLSHATVVVDPAGGHGNAFANDCTKDIFVAFVADPNAPLDTSCVAALPPPLAP
jgi:pimeloyl-ACP methyl ester carboxylesterase